MFLQIWGYYWLKLTARFRGGYTEQEEDAVWERAHLKYSRLVRDTIFGVCICVCTEGLTASFPFAGYCTFVHC